MEDKRIQFSHDLSILYLPFYNALCSKLRSNWEPYQGFRTFEQQEDLYKQGRTNPGPVVTTARGGESAHNYGCASDWLWRSDEGNVIWLEDDDPRWQEYYDALDAVGLSNGLSFGDNDHNNLKISIPWASLLSIFNESGMSSCIAKIKESMIK